MVATAFTICRNNGGFVALVRAGSRVRIAGLDIDKRLFPKLGEVSAGCRLQALRVNGLADTVRDIFQRRNTGRTMGCDFEDNKALPCADYARVFSRL